MEPNSWIILVKLIFAHLLADFVLQSKTMVAKKSERNIAAHLVHAFFQAATVYIVLAQWTLWYVAVVVMVSHFVIDYSKSYCGRMSKIKVFLIDQGLHIAICFALWIIIIGRGQICYLFDHLNFDQSSLWLYLTGGLMLLKPASLFIANFTDKWHNEDKPGLNNAGLWIGYFERLLIYLFILMSWYEGIGFLLAAKSIFRFGELKNEDLKTTEYVLIGTLLSFTIAVFVALIVFSLT